MANLESKVVLVPLAQSCEELEAVTIIDLLVRADVTVITASLDGNKVITGSRGVQLIAQTTLDMVLNDAFDMVILPGGLPGSDYLNQDDRIISLLQRMAESKKPVAAICAAPKVLVTAGLLDGKLATSFPGVIDQNPALGMTYLEDAVVEDSLVITSRSVGSAMDFALTLIERLCGLEVRQTVEKSLLRS